MGTLRAIITVLLCALPAFGQGIRLDNPTGPAFGTNGRPIANPIITVCTASAVGTPCSPQATTYTDATLATPCPNGSQVTLTQSNICQATGDSSGNFGFWVAPGTYKFSITAPSVTANLYTIMVPPITIQVIAGQSIQAAITTACATGGGTINIGPGTFAQTGPFTLCSNLNLIGSGRGLGDSGTCPTTITTNQTSGDLFPVTNMFHIHVTDMCIKDIAAAGANAAIRLNFGQFTTWQRLYISGPFAVALELDSSSTSTGSTIRNHFEDIFDTGLANNGIGCLLNSADATSKVINNNIFEMVACQGGATGASAAGVRLTNSGVHNQVINENRFTCDEAATLNGGGGGTGILIDQGSTADVTFIDCNVENNATGFNKATANTVQFIGGNISANGANVTDAQPGFTIMLGTRVGGVVQNFAITPLGDMYTDGLSVGGAAPVSNTIGGTSGWAIGASGSTVAFVNSTSLELNANKNLIMDAGSKLTQYSGIATAGNGIPVVFGATAQKTETGADANVLTFSPPAVPGTYKIVFVLSLSAANTATLGWTATWKDSNGNAQSPANLALTNVGSTTALTFTTSVSPNLYHAETIVDVDGSGTNIVVKLTFSGTSFTGKTSAAIERII